MGAIVAIGGALATLWVWNVFSLLAVVPGLISVAGLGLFSLRRRMVFDAEGGVLRIDQRIFGFPTRTTIPLFHLRAVVVRARPAASSPRFVATIDRRVGAPIFLEESPTCERVLRLAEAIREATGLRLVYEATPIEFRE